MIPKLLLDAIEGENAIGTGVRGASMFLLGNEIVGMIFDMRWAIIVVMLLIVADFHYGWSESKKRHKEAERKHNEILMDYYRWHKSRAWRRSANKLVDYIIIMFVFGAIGMAVLEPIQVSHTWGSWAGCVLACACEIASIVGHFFYLHGVNVETKSLKGFFKALAVAFARRKDPDIGESLQEAFDKTDNETNGK